VKSPMRGRSRGVDEKDFESAWDAVSVLGTSSMLWEDLKVTRPDASGCLSDS